MHSAHTRSQALVATLLGVALPAAALTLTQPEGSSASTTPTRGSALRSSLGSVPSGARYLSPSGSDSNPGTRQAPWRTLKKAQSAARPGATFVLLPGTYGSVGTTTTMSKSGTASAPITYRGEPGGSMPKIAGHFEISGSHQRFNYLLFDGPTGRVKPRTSDNPDGEQVQVSVYGRPVNGVEISDSEIRDSRWHAGIFLSTANDVRITGNYIHDNGDFSDPGQRNLSHGIYFSKGSGRIANNLIEHNLARGIQLYPNAQHTRITNNVIDGNGSGIIFAGNDRSTSDDALVEGNLITNARVRRNVESYYEAAGGIGRANLVRFNCIYATDDPDFAGADGGGIQRPTRGFDLRGNVVANPLYNDRAGGDYGLAADSPCRSLGKRVTAAGTAKRVARRLPVTLSGHVPGPVTGPVRRLKLRVRRNGSWHTVRRKTLDSADFSVPVYRRDANGDRVVEARVEAPGRRPSKPVRLRVAR